MDADVAQVPPLVDPVHRVIKPVRRRLRVRDLPRYLPVIRVLSARDMKVKYKQSILGPIWLIFQPLALLLVFLVAFRGLGNVKSSDIPYAVFALVGLTAWAFFQASLTIGTPSMISNVNFVRYTPCPRIAFIASSLIASLPSFGITGAAAIIGAAFTGHLSVRVLLLPVGLVWLVALTAGVVLITSAFAVRYRDVISALPFMLQLGVFLAPVGYPLAGLSPTVRTIVELNPLTGVIEAMRWMMLSGYRPIITPIILSLIITSVLLVVGWLVFSARETTMADVI
jgi:ABC-type polysaccharide/polyol phosphate export permease